MQLVVFLSNLLFPIGFLLVGYAAIACVDRVLRVHHRISVLINAFVDGFTPTSRVPGIFIRMLLATELYIIASGVPFYLFELEPRHSMAITAALSLVWIPIPSIPLFYHGFLVIVNFMLKVLIVSAAYTIYRVPGYCLASDVQYAINVIQMCYVIDIGAIAYGALIRAMSPKAAVADPSSST